MAEFEKVVLTKAETLAVMGIPSWYRRTAESSQAPAATQMPAAVQTPAAPAQPEARQTPPAEQKSPAPATQAQTAAQPAEAAAETASEPAQLIEFTWIRGASGLVLHGLLSDAATLKLLKDVVRYGDWVQGANATPAHGDFRWPQLVDTSGSPERALTTFVSKHLPSGGWLALTPEVHAQIEPWLPSLGVRVVELPALTHSIGDAATKKEIWQRLRALA